MTKHDEMTKDMTKQNPFSTNKHTANDGMTKLFRKTLLYLFIFLSLGTFQKTLRQRHFVMTKGCTK